jgi:PTS system ascorbate-specific IIA component
MNVALLLVTHKNIGRDLLAITGSIVDDELDNTACVEIPMDADVDSMKHTISGALAGLSTDDGVLILTDSYGSTPCNIASFFLDSGDRRLVSGLNLPMLVRVMNYRTHPLDELKDIAVEGGKKGIVSRAD